MKHFFRTTLTFKKRYIHYIYIIMQTKIIKIFELNTLSSKQ